MGHDCGELTREYQTPSATIARKPRDGSRRWRTESGTECPRRRSGALIDGDVEHRRSAQEDVDISRGNVTPHEIIVVRVDRRGGQVADDRVARQRTPHSRRRTRRVFERSARARFVLAGTARPGVRPCAAGVVWSAAAPHDPVGRGPQIENARAAERTGAGMKNRKRAFQACSHRRPRTGSFARRAPDERRRPARRVIACVATRKYRAANAVS